MPVVMEQYAGQPVIIGAGIAGLTVALEVAPFLPVVVLSRGPLSEQTSSVWAQGGIAAAFGPDDSAAQHFKDTITAGADLADRETVRAVTEAAQETVLWLRDQGVAFDTTPDGNFVLGLEGGHSRRRIVHVKGDGTGAAIMRALVKKVRETSNITVLEGAIATEIINKKMIGASRERLSPTFNPYYGIKGIALTLNGTYSVIPTAAVILATGGSGSLWQHTTNPTGSRGQGLVLAATAGADLTDLEFMQFHPTAMDVGLDPMPLATEALRGEGATLVNEKGERFMAGEGRAELESRDIVTRAIWMQMQSGHKVFLDARSIKNFATRFPTVYEYCQKAGIDPALYPIPIRPAAHYHMGGVAVGPNGMTSVPGLWACGETAATGLHGANRLASNSLLECVFFGRIVAKSLVADERRLRLSAVHNPASGQWPEATLPEETPDIKAAIRSLMTKHVGVLRENAGLDEALAELVPLATHSDMALAALLISYAAFRRRNSYGAHLRSDFPNPSEGGPSHLRFTLYEMQHWINSETPHKIPA